MSRKNKTLRSFLHQNPDSTIEEAWDNAWAAAQGHYASKKHTDQQARIDALEKALKSIASNTCCEPCQEAALVARQALLEAEK